MQTLLLTFALFAVVVLVLVAFVMLSGKSLRGSCGGPSCACASDGKDLGSCNVEDESQLPVHPG